MKWQRLTQLAQEHFGLGLVLAMSLYTRLTLLRWWGAAPSGDVVNFIEIARSLGRGFYPIADKRLPFYPFLILIGHTLIPWVTWEAAAITIAIVMSLLALILFYAIGRTLKFSKLACLTGLLLFTSFQPFLSYSIRGYADTTFTALLAAAILVLLQIHRPGRPIILGIIAGCLVLTRYEGFFAAAAVGFLALWELRGQWRRLGFMLAAGVLILLPYITICYRSGRSLLPETYLQQGASEEQGYGAASFNEFLDNYRHVWERLGLHYALDQAHIIRGELRDDAIGFHQQIVDRLAWPMHVVGIFGTIGLIFLILQRRWKHLAVIALPYLLAAIPIAWWAPLIRYDAMIFPLMILLAMAGFQAAIIFMQKAAAGTVWGTFLKRFSAVLLLTIATLVWMLTATHNAYNSLRKSRFHDRAFYEAVQYARDLPGVVAFDERRLLIEIYFGERAVFAEELFSDKDQRDVGDVLRDRNVRYLVTWNGNRSHFARLGNEIHSLAHFERELGSGNPTQADVYELHNSL